MNPQSLSRIIFAGMLALFLAACAGSAKQASTGEYIDDTLVTSRVKSALLNDPAVSGIAINVETYKGTVQLSGFVKTVAERNRAVHVSRTVPGVKRVQNDILIR
jgi:hyperosmotically inducible periplasmic protein